MPNGRPSPTAEPERTTGVHGPVDLCDGRGRLNPSARGWSRRPDVRANLRLAPMRKKRWDYWCVQTDEIVVSFVYADVDYAGLASVWVLDRATGHEATAGLLRPLSRGIELPEQVCTGAMAVTDRALSLVIDERDGHTRLTATAPTSAHGPIEVDVVVDKPAGHESLNVLIPWSTRRFQFTSKQNTRPAHGTRDPRPKPPLVSPARPMLHESCRAERTLVPACLDPPRLEASCHFLSRARSSGLPSRTASRSKRWWR